MGNTILRPIAYFQLSEKFQPLDFDETPYLETIKIVNTHDYSPVGKVVIYGFFLNQLKELLLLEETYRTEGKSLQNYKSNPKNRPLFVLGLPRTGTTYLHTLLSLDPKVRAPRKYELDNPSPRDTSSIEKDKQIKIKLSSNNNLNMQKTFAPQMLQLHDSSDVTRPEECVFVLSLFAPVKLITFLLPEYADMVLNWDWVNVYKGYWKILEMWEYFEMKMNGEDEVKRWVLKCPIHAWVMDSIIEAIPNADIIWTHRSLDDNVLSCSNLKTAVADIFLESRNVEEIGNGYLKGSEMCMKRADAVATSLKTHNPNNNKLIYCMYDNLIKNPINTIQSIYKQLNYEFTDEYENILKEYIEIDKMKRMELRKKAVMEKDENGEIVQKKATLETYGLTKEIVNERFCWLYEKYIINVGSSGSINDEKKEG